MQAAADVRVAGGGVWARGLGFRGILASVRNADSISVLCHLLADADCVNKRDEM